jgi:phosphate/sulfate permease
VIDVWASAGERIQLAFSWTDPLATAVLVVVLLLLALGLWVLGLQVLVTVGLLWVFR